MSKFQSIFLSLILFLFATTSLADNIPWQVTDQGGRISNSTNYSWLDASGQGAIGKVSSPNYALFAGYILPLSQLFQPPVAETNGPYVGYEDSTITFDGSGSYDPDGTIVSYEWDLDGDGGYDDDSGTAPKKGWGDDYSGIIGLKVTDDMGATDIDTTTVTINNVLPTVNIDSVEQPNSGFILLDDVLTFDGSFTDPGWSDTHTATWDFGDSIIEHGTITEENIEPDATGTTTATHAYSEPGTYTVTLTITDDDGGVGTNTIQMVVKTSAGAIEDLITIVESMNLQGGIENSLISKLNNAINSLDKGQENAAINKLNAFINEVEAQRGKKLTDEEAEELIQAAQAIIASIGSGEDAPALSAGTSTESPTKTRMFQNYPNPFNPETWIPFSLSEKAHVIIRIYNITGQLIRTLDLGEKEPGEYISKEKAAYWDGRNNSGEEVASGIYFYQLQVGSKVFTKKMVVLK